MSSELSLTRFLGIVMTLSPREQGQPLLCHFHPDWRRRREDFGGLLYNVATGNLLSVNEVGYSIIEMLSIRAPSIGELISHLRAEYGLESQGDFLSVRAFIEALSAAGVITHPDELPADGKHKVRVKRHVAGLPKGYRALSAPITVAWDLTSACNLRCRQCYSSSGKKLAHELTTTEALRLVDELASMSVFCVCLLGGEPLMRRDVFRILERCVEAGMRVLLTTNGWLVNDRVAGRLASIGGHHVRVSLDGATKLTHDVIRGVDGSFVRATSAVVALKHAGVRRVGVSPTLMPENFHEREQIVDLALELGADEIRIGQVCNVGRARSMARLSSDQTAEIRELLQRKTSEAGTRISISGPEGIWADKPHRKEVAREALLPDMMGCGGGRSLTAVSPDGTVKCCILNGLPLGNLREESFPEIWCGTSPNLNWLRSIKDACKGCRYSFTCAGPCPLERANHPNEQMTRFVSDQCVPRGNPCEDL